MGREKVIIVGFGGLGREILWTARRAQKQAGDFSAEILGYTEKTAPGTSPVVDGLPCLGLEGPRLLDLKPEAPTHFICAIGENRKRKQLCEQLEAMGLKPMSVIDPSVIIAPGVSVGEGSYVAAGSILSPGSTLGRHVVVNQGCTIGHDSSLGDYAQACPGSRVSGWVKVGEGALLGSNAVAAPRVSIGAWSTLAAASFASRDLADGVVAIGVPAKLLFKNPPAASRKEPA
jgi:sugar O-acyltransferase (sialic acid O-acetyltransferase NeuD family)